MDIKRAADYLRDARAGNRELREAEELGAQALEAWAWVEERKPTFKHRGDGSNGWQIWYYDECDREAVEVGPTPLAAVLDAMEKEAAK